MNKHESINAFLPAWMSVKHRMAHVESGRPMYTEGETGPYFYDENKKKYIDFLMGWGTVLLGYNDKRIINLAKKHIHEGFTSNAHKEIEIKVAKKFNKFYSIPMRTAFMLNGSDATSAAVRIARYITGREMIVYTGYHGWNEWAQPQANGVLNYTGKTSKKIQSTNSAELLEFIKTNAKSIACVVIEIPMLCDNSVDTVKAIKNLSDKFGFLIVFDEIKSGLRMGFTPGLDKYGVVPHMATYGKAFSAGYPFSALVVREDIAVKVPDTIALSATFWGFPLSLYIVDYMIDYFEYGNVQGELEQKSRYFVDNCNELFLKTGFNMKFKSVCVMPILEINESEKVKERFYKLLLENGIYIRPKHCLFTSLSHTKKVTYEVLEKLSFILTSLLEYR